MSPRWWVKHLALIFALFWLAQAAVCLLPGLAHAHSTQPTAVAEFGDYARHGHHGASTSVPASTPAPEHDAGCDQHCASLTQALSPLSPAVGWTATLWLPLDSVKMQLVVQLVAARRLESRHGPPPPDLVLTNATFLI